MNRKGVIGAAASLSLMGWLATAAQPTGAQLTAITLSPMSGPAGTTITVSGSGCAGRDPRVVADFGTLVDADFTTMGSSVEITPQADGSWSGTVRVPAGPVPGPNYAVSAACENSDQDEVYEKARFEVTPTDAPRATAAAQPAAAVSDTPDLAG